MLTPMSAIVAPAISTAPADSNPKSEVGEPDPRLALWSALEKGPQILTNTGKTKIFENRVPTFEDFSPLVMCEQRISCCRSKDDAQRVAVPNRGVQAIVN